MYYRLTEDGQVVKTDLDTFSMELKDFDKYRRIASTDIRSCNVSTVFLGIDHGHTLSEENPIVFETMVFANCQSELDNSGIDYYQRRYRTLEEAKKGHQETIDMVLEYKEEKDETT